jgi:hypothetical protein
MTTTKNKSVFRWLMAGCTAGLMSTALMADEAVITNSFYPYNTETPSFDGLKAGMVIDQSNVAQFKDAIDPAFYGFIEQGMTTITVGETTSFDLHPNYVEATRVSLGQVSLGNEVGEISGWSAGRPFPEEPDANDPRAGEKLAWNYKGRVTQEPTPEITPNPSDLFRAIYVQVLDPADVRNTQLLIHRAADDLKRDNSWLYLGFQRRVRRLATGQVTDAFLGSDLMIEDFEGYNGRISDMNWTYKGTRYMLMPFYNHNDLTLDAETHIDSDGYQVVSFSGQGGCFPDITWQLRKVYEVESVPVDESHPLSKRVHFMDAQTFTIPRTVSYDRKGSLWKTFTIGQAHPDHHLPKNKGSGVSIDDSFSMIDVQASHCTTGQFKGQVDPELSPPQMFNVQHLRATGS